MISAYNPISQRFTHMEISDLATGSYCQYTSINDIKLLQQIIFCFLLDLCWNHLAGHICHIQVVAEFHICIWPGHHLGRRPSSGMYEDSFGEH